MAAGKNYGFGLDKPGVELRIQYSTTSWKSLQPNSQIAIIALAPEHYDDHLLCLTWQE